MEEIVYFMLGFVITMVVIMIMMYGGGDGRD